MAGSSFDFIVQELQKQQRIMKALSEENRALRCQLAELRAGHGVFVEICGQRFSLHSLLAEPLPLDTDKKTATNSALSLSEAAPSSAENSTVTVTELSPKTTQKLTEATEATPSQQISEPSSTSTFLEEIMLDEFSTTMTSPMSVWTGPTKKLEITEEEKNAALRRALMGSFILE